MVMHVVVPLLYGTPQYTHFFFSSCSFCWAMSVARSELKRLLLSDGERADLVADEAVVHGNTLVETCKVIANARKTTRERIHGALDYMKTILEAFQPDDSN